MLTSLVLHPAASLHGILRPQNFGIDLGVRMCRQLLDAGTPGLHMYTLNLEKSALAILERLGLIDTQRVQRVGVRVRVRVLREQKGLGSWGCRIPRSAACGSTQLFAAGTRWHGWCRKARALGWEGRERLTCLAGSTRPLSDVFPLRPRVGMQPIPCGMCKSLMLTPSFPMCLPRAVCSRCRGATCRPARRAPWRACGPCSGATAPRPTSSARRWGLRTHSARPLHILVTLTAHAYQAPGHDTGPHGRGRGRALV